MHIVVVGVDHTTAPIALRERLACSPRQIASVLQAARWVAQESVLLSTCNRIELYAVCSDAGQGIADLLQVLSETRQVPCEELEAHCYSFVDMQAVSHLFGVASGLYSLVPGEPQIQGQVVEALEAAREGDYAGPITSALFRAAVVTGKRARSETEISRNAASLSHVAVQLARRLLPNFNASSILLVGSGKMSELAARNLRDNGAQRLVIVNRTQAHAVELAQSLQATHRTFTELFDALIEADVAITSTTAPRALITTELMQRVIARRGERSLLLIDLALPRDVEPAVAALPAIHLYNLDDLQTEVNKGIHLRLQEAEHVQAIISEECEAFERWLASLDVVDTITDLRRQVEALRQQELARTFRQISPVLSDRERAAINELSNRLINKLLHTPMLRLKDAASTSQGHIYVEAMRHLFALDDTNKEENTNADYNRDTGKQTRDDSNPLGDRTITPAVAHS